MSKWKCEICNSEFDNFHAQGFNHKIYCPLCYFKELNIRKDKEIERLNNIINTFEEDLEREVNISEQESMVGNYRYTVIHSTFEKMLKYFKELKESGNNE